MLPLHVSVPWEMREFIEKTAERNGSPLVPLRGSFLLRAFSKIIEEAE